MPDLHGWITQQIDKAEDAARRKHDAKCLGREFSFFMTGQLAGIKECGCTGDASALRRCAADRKILARHRLNPNAIWYDAAMCDGCGTEDEMAYARTENLNDCPELLDLGHAHGLTPEILAGLDRPQEGERPEPGAGFRMPDAIAESFVSFWLGTRPMEPSPKEKAIKILAPELKKIPGYVPTTEEEQ